MKHIKLFENFNSNKSVDMDTVSSMVSQAANDNQMKSYNLTIDETNPEAPLLIWNNPQDDEDWRNSGYADAYSDLSSVAPMNVLAFVNHRGDLFAYKLTPEEKESGNVLTDEYGYEPDQMVRLRSFDDLKKAFMESLWEMD